MYSDHVLPDTGRIRIYAHGGLDVRDDHGEWISVATNPEACAELAKLALRAADIGAKFNPEAPAVELREMPRPGAT